MYREAKWELYRAVVRARVAGAHLATEEPERTAPRFTNLRPLRGENEGGTVCGVRERDRRGESKKKKKNPAENRDSFWELKPRTDTTEPKRTESRFYFLSFPFCVVSFL